MSAQLTVYTMAIEAERPLRMREADQERLAAQADTSLGQRATTLFHQIGQLLCRSWWQGVTAGGRAISGPVRSSVTGQLAG